MKKTEKFLYLTIILLLMTTIFIQMHKWIYVYDISNFYETDYIVMTLKIDEPPSEDIEVLKNGLLQDTFDIFTNQIKILLKDGDVLEIDARKNTRRYNLELSYPTKEVDIEIVPKTVMIETGLYRFPPFCKKTL